MPTKRVHLRVLCATRSGHIVLKTLVLEMNLRTRRASIPHSTVPGIKPFFIRHDEAITTVHFKFDVVGGFLGTHWEECFHILFFNPLKDNVYAKHLPVGDCGLIAMPSGEKVQDMLSISVA